MLFTDRVDAGKKLAALLRKYQGEDLVVLALPRGGVVVAAEIAKALTAPLGLLLAHKIGHPHQVEYAIGAVSESGQMIGNSRELALLGEEWLAHAKERELQEMRRKRELYLKGRPEIPIAGKVVILVDDGIATGLTMQVGILELKIQHPKKIIAAVPVAPERTYEFLAAQVDDVVACEVPPEGEFLGGVGAYYIDFKQTEDREVIEILNRV